MAPATPGFAVRGAESQIAEIGLAPGEAAIGDARWLLSMGAGITMRVQLPDGNALAATRFTNESDRPKHLAFAPPCPGQVLAADLPALGGTLLCRKDSFLCSTPGLVMRVAQQLPVGGGFDPEGLVLHALTGGAPAFVHAGGLLVQHELATGEQLLAHVDSVLALTPGVRVVIAFAGAAGPSLTGGDALFLAQLTGPGTAWLQSHSPFRCGQRVFVPSTALSATAAGDAGGP